MKRLVAKLTLSVFGFLALFGVFAQDAKAALIGHIKIPKIENVTESTPLYLMHANDLFAEDGDLLTWHYSHQSHASHASHASHQSHYSHYSSRW